MFRGSIVALATPFQDNFDVDFDAYGRMIDFQLEHGTDGIVPCGCTGEAATLGHEEQEAVIRFCIERVAGRVPVIAGTGSNNTAEALRLTRFAKEAGADGALLITPYYNKPTAEGQIAHYTYIADRVDIPIMLYNVPGRTGTKIMPETIAAMSKHKNITSVKEACGSVDQVSQIIAQCDITVLSGDDSLTLPMMAVGATGVVSVVANIMPRESASLCKAFDAGDLARAKELHYAMLPVVGGLFLESNPMPVKWALSKMGLCKNVLRLPLTPIKADTEKKFEPILKAAGVI